MHIEHSPFYEWLEHEAIRDVVHRAQRLTPGERLVLIKGLIPGLVDETGLAQTMAFLDELVTKARRFDEAQTYPGQGRRTRHIPGESLGGPTPRGHVHAEEHRNPDRPGGHDAERAWEARLWTATRDRGASDSE